MESYPQYKTHNWGMKWTEEEDFRLLQAIERFGGSDWKKIADYVGTRDAVKCIQRWDKVLRPDLIKGKWTEEEDNLLRYVVMQGFEHWGKVCERMPGRTAKQCRERWANYLDPSLLKTPFTQTEDEILLALQKEHGNKWSLISRQLPGRTENAVKLRYHALMRAYGAAVRTANLQQQQQQQQQQLIHPTQTSHYPAQQAVPSSSGMINASSSSATYPYQGEQHPSDENLYKRQRTGGIPDQYMYAPQNMTYYAQPGCLPGPQLHPSYIAVLPQLHTFHDANGISACEQESVEPAGGADRPGYGYNVIFAPPPPPRFTHTQDADPVQGKSAIPLASELDFENAAALKEMDSRGDAIVADAETSRE